LSWPAVTGTAQPVLGTLMEWYVERAVGAGDE
jgi:hypothetical protein